MKRVLELIISLIATAATYALMHVVLFMDLFKFQHKLPVYVPTVIAVIVGLIFYFLLATPLAGLLLKRLNQTEEPSAAGPLASSRSPLEPLSLKTMTAAVNGRFSSGASTRITSPGRMMPSFITSANTPSRGMMHSPTR